MAALGASDSSSRDKAIAALRAAAAGGGGAKNVSPYQIPVRTGGYIQRRPVNQGQFDDDDNTYSKVKETVNKDIVDRFSLTDEGIQAAIGSWYSIEDEDRSQLMKRMWFLGLIKSPTDFDSAFGVWKAAVGHAAGFAQQGREIDPRDVLEMLADGEQGAGNRQKAGPVTRRQVDLTDPETAKAWVQQAFAQSMGRQAEDAEVRALVDALNDRERANPTVSTTTPTKWDENGNPIDSTTTTSGGFNSDAFIQSTVDADPEATAHQAAGELYPALLAALGGGLS